MGKKAQIALISIFSNSFLTLIKLTAGIISGSISLVSEGFHSLGDLFASGIAFYSVKEADKPADKEHQFGHGKFEDLAGFVEGLLIILSALFIIYVGSEKIINKNTNYTFHANLAIYIMLFSMVINFIVAKYLLKQGKTTESNALLGDGYHLIADVYSSLAVIIGLIAAKLTGYYILDPIIAILTGAMILRTGINLTKQTSSGLLDASLPDENLKIINSILEEYKTNGFLKIKNIKTSKSGKIKNIILEIYLPCSTTLKECHKLCREIENKLEIELKNTNIVIKPEPDCKCEQKDFCKANHCS